MPTLMHDFSIYYDKNNVRHCVAATSLSDATILSHLKNQELYDETEQKQLAPRWGIKITPHFYETGTSTGTRQLFKGENNPIHNDRVSLLLKLLKEATPAVFALVAPGKAPNSDRVVKFHKLGGYVWGSEIQRILSKTAIVRHDVFGQSSALSMSVNQPTFAIEVINTHYPDEPAFQAMLETSSRQPLIVLFDFTAEPNSFIKIDEHVSMLRIRPWTFYIKNGAVWKGETLTKIASSAHLQIEVTKMLSNWAANRSKPTT